MPDSSIPSTFGRSQDDFFHDAIEGDSKDFPEIAKVMQGVTETETPTSDLQPLLRRFFRSAQQLNRSRSKDKENQLESPHKSTGSFRSLGIHSLRLCFKSVRTTRGFL